MKLIEDWRRAWKFVSVQAMVLAGAVQGAWEGFNLKDDVPHWLVTSITMFLLFVGIGGRVVKQKPHPKRDDET